MALEYLLEQDPFAYFRTVCPYCQAHTPESITPDEEIVCDICACIKDRLFVLDVPTDVVDADGESHSVYTHFGEDTSNFVTIRARKGGRKDSRSNYSRIFHLNEILAQMALQSPPIPEPLLLLILETVKSGTFGKPENFTYAHIRKICRVVNIPTGLQRKYQSEPRPQNGYNQRPLQSLRRYTERWRWILKQIWDYYCICENKIPEVDGDLKRWIQNFFEERLIPAFNQIDKKNRTHFPNYTYTIMKLLQYNDFQQGITHRHPYSWVRKFRYWCPIPSREKCKQLDELLWRPMCLVMGIPHLRTLVARKLTRFGDGTFMITNHMI